MSGIAELLANLGYVVSGSDEKRSAVSDRLASLGIRVSIGHEGGHVGGADVVVISSAVRSDNAEVVEAARRDIPVIPRAEMLAELMRLRYSIAVAGAHGKTTTTSMIALALERAGLDPTAVIGGRLSAFGSNARLGKGELMVAEADESDRSFLKLFPTIAVITNIDHEHLENYGGFDDLRQAFVDFANKVPFYGAVVACADDPTLVSLLPQMTRRVRTYGLEGREADVTATDVVLGPMSVSAVIRRRAARRADASADTAPILGSLLLHVPGRHNLQNALAAIAVGLEIGAAVRTDRSRPARIPRSGAPVRGARRAARHPHRRRLRASSNRDRRGDGGGARARPAHHRGVSAAPVHADRDADGGIRSGPGRSRHDRSHGYLQCRGGPDPGRDGRRAGRRNRALECRAAHRRAAARRCGECDRAHGQEGRPGHHPRRRFDRYDPGPPDRSAVAWVLSLRPPTAASDART